VRARTPVGPRGAWVHKAVSRPCWRHAHLVDALLGLPGSVAGIDLSCQVGQRRARRSHIQRLALLGAEDVREELLPGGAGEAQWVRRERVIDADALHPPLSGPHREDAPQRQVCVGQRGQAARLPVAHRPRVRARRLRPDLHSVALRRVGSAPGGRLCCALKAGRAGTWNTPVRKCRREPPPAATVLMSSCGAWMVTPARRASARQPVPGGLPHRERRGAPAVTLSNTCSYVPAKRDTSVEVPPMSKPMICCDLASAPSHCVVSA